MENTRNSVDRYHQLTMTQFRYEVIKVLVEVPQK